MRVNARLDESTQQQLDYLAQVTGQSVSHVVRESVAHYYAEVKRQRKPSRFLAMAGSWSSGRSDTASDVKAALSEALDAKFPQPRPLPTAPALTPAKPTAKATAARQARKR
jgi:predicted transcriptional regulator